MQPQNADQHTVIDLQNTLQGFVRRPAQTYQVTFKAGTVLKIGIAAFPHRLPRQVRMVILVALFDQSLQVLILDVPQPPVDGVPKRDIILDLESIGWHGTPCSCVVMSERVESTPQIDPVIRFFGQIISCR